MIPHVIIKLFPYYLIWNYLQFNFQIIGLHGFFPLTNDIYYPFSHDLSIGGHRSKNEYDFYYDLSIIHPKANNYDFYYVEARVSHRWKHDFVN